MMKHTSTVLRRFLLLTALVLALSVLGCPVYRLLHRRCPGCGLTRAWLYCLAGDWRRAFQSHALFLPAPLFLYLFVLRDTQSKKRQGRIDLFLCIFAASMAVYHIVRIL